MAAGKGRNGCVCLKMTWLFVFCWLLCTIRPPLYLLTVYIQCFLYQFRSNRMFFCFILSIIRHKILSVKKRVIFQCLSLQFFFVSFHSMFVMKFSHLESAIFNYANYYKLSPNYFSKISEV